MICNTLKGNFSEIKHSNLQRCMKLYFISYIFLTQQWHLREYCLNSFTLFEIYYFF